MSEEKETKYSSFIQKKMQKKILSHSSLTTPSLKHTHSRNSSKNLSEIGFRVSSNPYNKD
jgi:hypothetical protein